MAVIIGSARIDENGKAHGGKAGDNNGRELSVQSWYRHDGGWVLLRPKDPAKAAKIAACMRAACANQNIGYDQYQRDTLYTEAKKSGFDCAKVAAKVETDCSALVRVCCAFAGIVASNFRTTNEAAVLMFTGAFTKLTDAKYTDKSDYLRVGDILVTKSQGHTVVVLSDGPKAEATITPPVTLAVPPTPAQPYLCNWVYATADANVRTGPGTNYTRKVVLLKGTGLVFDGAISGEWYAVWWHGQRCWVSSRNAQIEVHEKPIVDLSQHNTITDWDAFCKQISYAWLRVGIRSMRSNGEIKKDTQFDRFATELQKRGIPFGVYFYGRAKTVAQGAEEADKAMEWTKDYNPTTYAYDAEVLTNTPEAVQAFTDRVTNKTGVPSGVYVGRGWKRINCSALRVAFRWGPRYRNMSGGTHGKNPTNTYDVHQYACSYRFKGAPGNVDVSHLHGPLSIEWFRSGGKAVSGK